MNKLLPLGTVLFLNEGTQKLMVVGRGSIVNTEKGERMFDYAACLFPIGVSKDNLYFFNEEDVSTVLFEGYSNEDEIQFNKVYSEWIKTTNVVKGKVD